jgi:glutaminyl-tRNA synthetase
MATTSLDEFVALFERCGIESTFARNIAKNKNNASFFSDILRIAGVAEAGCDNKTGPLLFAVASKTSVNSRSHVDFLAKNITNGTLRTAAQVDAAIAYVNKIGDEVKNIDVAEFERESGVGVVFTPETIERRLDELIKARFAEKLAEMRYFFPIGEILSAFKEGDGKFADMAQVKTQVSAKIESILGPKTEEDLKPRVPAAKTKEKDEQARKAKEAKEAKEAAEAAAAEAAKNESIRELIGRELNTSRNTSDLIAKHKAETGGVPVITRFPPEPNGYLHIGHAKAMNFNFGYAAEAGGICYLRFDDTNPEAERDEYIDSIEADVRWMGFSPYKVTASSDHFARLLEIAKDLIKRDLAYVDHQTGPEIKEFREKRLPSPWRNRPVEESLREFEKMCEGRYEEGTATLRLKMDYAHDNPNMRDLVAYRIKYHPHPKTGNTYCVYPSYDYTHCLCDSFENITHSLCTLEFEVRREPYFWILDAVHTWKPAVWEYSRLNITRNVLSKRKLIALVNNGVVRGWDDPRMLTIRGLRRRGYTPDILKDFCNRIGVTRTENHIGYELLEQCARLYHDTNADRRFGVLDPLRIVITNFETLASATVATEISLPNHPKNAERGKRTLSLEKELLIEKTDYRTVDSSDYYGLAPGKEVSLRYANLHIRATGVRESDGAILVEAIHGDACKKVKGFIHWVPASKAVAAEARLYEPLYLDDDGEKLNPESETVLNNAVVEPSMLDLPAGTVVQLERVGFFVVDQDSTKDKIVLVRNVTLKESYAK